MSPIDIVHQLGTQYESSLKLQHEESPTLDLRDVDLPEFHNNLAVESQVFPLMILANRRKLYLYNIDTVSGAINSEPFAEVDLRPTTFKESYISGANWPGDPHSVNFVKLASITHRKHTSGVIKKREILVTAGDDGRVLLFRVKDLFTLGESAKPFAVAERSCSAWGLAVHEVHGLLAVSDNSHCVSIYRIPTKAAFSKVTHAPIWLQPLIISPDLKKNIPDVDFVQDSEPETCRVAAISISGEVAIWEFYFGNKLASYRPLQWTKSENKSTRSSNSSSRSNSGYSSDAMNSDITVNNDIDQDDDYYPHEQEHERDLGSDAEVITEDLDSPGSSITANLNNRMWNIMETDDIDDYIYNDTSSNTQRRHQESNVPRTNDYNTYNDDTGLHERTHSVDEDVYMEYEDLSEASDSDYDYDDHIERQVRSSPYGPCIVYENLKQQGWTVNVLDGKDFKHVNSLFEATANQWLVESTFFKQVRANNSEVNQGRGDDDYHPRSKFPCFMIETVPSQSSCKAPWSMVAHTPHYSLHLCAKTSKKTASPKNNAKQNTKEVAKSFINNQNSLDDKFVLLTSQKSLYLCQLQDLHCNAATASVFYWQPKLGIQETYFDRMSIVHVLPSLSAVIVVSQIGAVSVFRLVCYKGIYTIRQEYCFPEGETFTYSESALRVVAGVSVKELKNTHGIVDHARLRIIYTDGFSLQYTLAFPDDTGNEVLGDCVF